jgi:hypothetical protein
MGKEVFENYNWGAATYRKIKFYGTSQFHRGDKDYNDEDDDTDNTGWDHVDNEMHVVERGVRWDKQKLVVDAAKIQVLNSLAITFNIGTGASVARKRAHLGEFKARVAAYKTGVNKLNHPSMTTEHMNVIIEGRVEYKVWELKITPLEKELEEIWAKQYQATNEVYESAKAVKEQREDNAPTVTLRDFVEHSCHAPSLND